MVVKRIAASVAARQVIHVEPVAERAATGDIARIYAQVRREFKIVLPPVLAHSPAPDLVAAMWMLMREPLVAVGAVDRATKEVVASAVSLATTCPFCVDMHSTGLYELSTADDAEALAGDRLGDIADPRLRQVARWARSAHLPAGPELGDRTPGELAELVGVLVSFHYTTRMVNVFQPGYLLPPRLGTTGRRRFKQGLSHILAPVLRGDWPAGASVGFLPPGGPPPAWAAGNPGIADAVARAYAVFEAAGERSVPTAVRDLVRARLAEWDGTDPGLSRAWCEDLLAGLAPADRASGRLALLTAFASFQVGPDVIDEFRRHRPGDLPLLDTTAWASHLVAGRIGDKAALLEMKPHADRP